MLIHIYIWTDALRLWCIHFGSRYRVANSLIKYIPQYITRPALDNVAGVDSRDRELIPESVDIMRCIDFVNRERGEIRRNILVSEYYINN